STNFDAWGRRRNPADWSFTNVSATYMFDRGFTGHEHLDEFGLINMNGRVYDPLLGRFLSPDNYIQVPDYTQSLNRYSYALNNPLVYTDPSGEIIFTIIGALLAPVTGGASLAIGIAMDVSWMTDYAIQAATNYLSNPNGTPEDWFFKDIDIVDLGVSAVAGGISQGLSNVGKLRKGHKLLERYYKGVSALSENTYGQGKVIYYGSLFNQESFMAVIDLYSDIFPLHPFRKIPEEVEIIKMKYQNEYYFMLLNYSDSEVKINLGKEYLDLISNRKIKNEIEAYGVAFIKE
ncbi:MAG: RHS repeat-associated core domain-containing protein, partial [Halanaerobiales bacterium]